MQILHERTPYNGFDVLLINAAVPEYTRHLINLFYHVDNLHYIITSLIFNKTKCHKQMRYSKRVHSKLVLHLLSHNRPNQPFIHKELTVTIKKLVS